MNRRRSGSSLRIGVFGHYGNQNLGDESIIEAVIQAIRRHAPGAEIHGFSTNPDDTSSRYGVPAHPIDFRRAGHGDSAPSRFSKVVDALKTTPLVGFLVKVLAYGFNTVSHVPGELAFMAQSYRRLKALDLLMVSGSNQFLDNFGGPSGFPYTLLKWTLVSKLAGVPIVFVSVGAGPIFSPLSMALIRAALLGSSYTSFRDDASKRLIERRWIKDTGVVYPDLAHGLDMSRYAAQRRRPASDDRRLTVGINPMAVYDRRYWYVHDDSKYAQYVRKLSDFAHRLMKEGYRVVFFPTQIKDENVIDDVLQCMRESGIDVDAAEQGRKPRSVYELMDIIDSADLLVVTRFHGTVLSLLSEKPTLGICYYRKAEDLLKEMHQGDYAVTLDDFTVDDLYERFKKLESRKEAERDRIAETGRRYSRALEEQYHTVMRVPNWEHDPDGLDLKTAEGA